MANIIKEIKIKNLQPVVWYGQQVVDKHTAITKVIGSQLGSKYANLFAQPQLTDSSIKGKSVARWLSNTFTEASISLNELNEEDYLKAKVILKEKTDKVIGFANKLLLSEKDENVKWGQLILKAIIYPDESYVLYENGDVTIFAWGFELIDSSMAISGYSKDVTKNGNTEKSQLENHSQKHNTEEEEEEEEEEITNDLHKGKETNETEEQQLQDPSGSVNPDHEKLNRDEKKKEEEILQKTSFFKRYWWLLLLLLIIIALVIYFLLKKDPANNLIDNEDSIGQVIPPINPVDIITSPDSLTNIVSDRLNVALHGDNKDIDNFCKNLKKVYPNDIIKIIYKDEETSRIQIQVPKDKLSEIKDELPSKMSGYNLLIWHENLFKKNNTFNDPGFSNNSMSWYFDEVQAEKAWDITQGNKDIVIAVLDSGFDIKHPELQGKIYKPWDVTTRSSVMPYHPEYSIHGTHVASISAANSNNNDGVSGIAPKCKIMPIKVGDNNGTLASSYVVDGFLYAINHGADVINMSLGLYVHPMIETLPEEAQMEIIDNSFKDEEQFWQQLFDIALENNTAVVLAGGNQNVLIGIDPLDRSNYPIKVSATNKSGTKANFSNWGDYSDVSAPGDNIYSATGDNNYDYLSGTSMAAPIVTGAVALLKSVKKDIAASDIKYILKATGKYAYAPNNKEIGNIIQIKGALVYAETGELPVSNCNNVQEKIDSLKTEIEKLKNECGLSQRVDTLHIPKNISKKTIINGRWKSTSPLHNDLTKEKVELYFDINDSNNGIVTFVENDGTLCTAPLNIKLTQDKLSFKQETVAVCDDNENYQKYTFICRSDSDGTAICNAFNQNTKEKDVEFLLIRVR